MRPRDRWAIETIERQVAVLARREREVATIADPVDRCAGWLALRRQAPGYVRYLRPWIPGVGFDGAIPAIHAHRETLQCYIDRADRELSGFDEPVMHAARARVGLRLAVIGKGGAGKTVIASTLCRLLARRGRQVLAADLDTNPGLAISLGMPPTEAGLPAEAIEAREGANYGSQLATGLDPMDAVKWFSRGAPDGVRYLGVGKINSLGKDEAKKSVPAVVQILLGVGDPAWDVIADLEAGPTTPFERYHGFASDAMVVFGPAWRSAMTAHRLLPMVAEVNVLLMASQWRNEADHPGLDPWGRIPFDPAVRDAERQGLAPLDACPEAPAIRAMEELIDRLLVPVTENRGVCT